MQQRLRAVFNEHLSITIDWHVSVLDKAMQLLAQQDAAAGWRADATSGGGGAARLASARGLMLECRKQADNALTVLVQSAECVRGLMGGVAGVLQARAHLAPAGVLRFR